MVPLIHAGNSRHPVLKVNVQDKLDSYSHYGAERSVDDHGDDYARRWDRDSIHLAAPFQPVLVTDCIS